jgi:hypothetical protein
MELDLLFPLPSLGSVRREEDISPCTGLLGALSLETKIIFYVFSREDMAMQDVSLSHQHTREIAIVSIYVNHYKSKVIAGLDKVNV